MSNQGLPRLFTWRTAITESDLSSTTKWVLVALSLYMNEKGESCFPSTKRLAQDTGFTERTVCTHLMLACDQGWLYIRNHGYGDQRWRRHEYVPSTPDREGAEPDSAPRDEGTEPDSAPSDEGTEPHAEKALNEVQWKSSGGIHQGRQHPVGSSTPEEPAANGKSSQRQTQELLEGADEKAVDATLPSRSQLPMKGPHYIYPDGFENLWRNYPRQEDKAAAYDAWRQKVRQGHDAELILQGAIAYNQQMTSEQRDPDKIKMPKTWLNNDGWLEYVDDKGHFVGYCGPQDERHKSLDELFGFDTGDDEHKEGVIDV